MQHVMVSGETLPEAYHKSLIALQEDGYYVDCPAYNTKCKEVSMLMVVRNPLQEPMISKETIAGPYDLQKYVMELCDGIMDFMVGLDKNMWSYTYHMRFVKQLPFVVKELKRDPSTRRAVMNIRNFAVDSKADDPACMQSIAFYIRNGKLHMKVLFRSNDAFRAAFMNAFALIQLQKRVADAVGIEVGSYTHCAWSYHVYADKDGSFNMFEKHIERISNAPNHLEGLTYNYDGEFKPMMEDSVPEIINFINIERSKHGLDPM